MPKIQRKTQKIFCNSADSDQIAVFGSMATGTPVYSNDVEQLQSNEAYGIGWDAATLEDKAPFMEEMNGMQYCSSYQLAYILQQGIPEWDAETEYFANTSFCQVSGVLYQSKTDNNIGNNPVNDTTNWSEFGFSNYVKKTGDIMTGNLAFDFDQNVYRGIDSTLKGYEIGVKPSTEQRGLRVISYDKNGEYVTAAQARCKADGWNVWNIIARNFVNGVQNQGTLSVQASDTGDSGLWFNSKQMLYVEDFYVSGSSFYMIFNKRAGQTKRWCIQGGAYDNTAGGNSLKSVSYLKEFYSDGNCLWLTNVSTDSSQSASMRATSIYSKSATGFEIYRANNTPWIYWLAIGYLAEGQ